MVSGVAALVYSYFDGIGPADVKEILLKTAKPLDGLSGLAASGGIVDAGAALAFDLSGLSGQGFSNAGSAPESGTAPYIETKFSSRLGKSYLTVRVVDVDGDLETLAYNRGELTAPDFAGGAAGEPFTINSNDVATFRIDNAGTYTFYARDKNGNESVKVVKITEEQDGPGA